MKAIKHKLLLILALVSVSFVTACAAPSTNAARQTPAYQPLTHELAVMADPQNADAKPLHCQLGLGTAKFDRGFSNFSTVRFDMLETSRVTVPLTSNQGAQLHLQGIFDRQGQKIIFCPVKSGAPDQKIACNSFYALDEDLQMGIRRTFDIPDAVTGSTITCGYDITHIPPLS